MNINSTFSYSSIKTKWMGTASFCVKRKKLGRALFLHLNNKNNQEISVQSETSRLFLNSSERGMTGQQTLT